MGKLKTKPSFELAKMKFQHRYTCEFIPAWAKNKCDNGLYYAPHFATDAEWYLGLDFTDSFMAGTSTNETWPHGKWLQRPGRIGSFVTATPEYVKNEIMLAADKLQKLAAQFDLEFRCIVG